MIQLNETHDDVYYKPVMKTSSDRQNDVLYITPVQMIEEYA